MYTSLITLLGAIIAALATLWQTYRNDKNRIDKKKADNIKKFMPSVVLFLGALIVAFSVWLSSLEKNKKEKII